MNFDDAIKAHTFWKVSLRWMINNGKPLDDAHIGSPHECELGHWILGEGACHHALPAFQALITQHEEFHRIAGQVVKSIETGQGEVAQNMLAPDGSFSLASAKTIEAIRELKDCVESRPHDHAGGTL